MTDDAEAQTPPLNAVESSPNKRYWRFDEILGRGAFKTVFKSFDSREGTEVAWNKVQLNLAANECRLRKRLFSEIHVLKRLKHKNIMTFHDYWLDDGTNTLNFITELFTHGSLKKFRAKHKHLELKVLKKWAWQILQGLVYLHGHEPPIIHRDLKCDNVLINGVTGNLKIGDLGLATLWREGLGPQSIGGTPEFMAPEFYDEFYNEKVDVYAFGMLLLELESMDYPYSECTNTLAIYKKVSQGVLPASVQRMSNDDLREFIKLCIAYSPDERPEARKLLKHPFFDEIRKTMEPDRQPSDDVDHDPLGRLSEASCSERSCHTQSLSHQESKSSRSSAEMEEEEQHSHAESTSNGVKIRIGCSKVEDEPKLNFTLTYDPPGGPPKCIRFPFDIINDTAQQIVDEMRAESIDTDLMITEEEATIIGHLIAEEVDKWRVKDEGEMVSYVNVMRPQPESPRGLMPVNPFEAREVLESKMDDICQTVASDLTEGSVFRTLEQGNKELMDYYHDNSARSHQRPDVDEFESDEIFTDDGVVANREDRSTRASMDDAYNADAIDIPKKRRLSSTHSQLEPSNSISSTVSDSKLHLHERRGSMIGRSIVRRLSTRQNHSEGPTSGLRTSVLRSMSLTVDGGSNPTESPLKSTSPQCQPMEMRLVVAQPNPENDVSLTDPEGTIDNDPDLRSSNRSFISMLTMKPSKKSWEGYMPTVPEASVSTPRTIRPNPVAISKADEWQWTLANGLVGKESDSSHTTGVSPRTSVRRLDSNGSLVDHGFKSPLHDLDSCSKSDANLSLASRSKAVDGMGIASQSSSAGIGRSMEEMHELDLNDQDQAFKGPQMATDTLSLARQIDQMSNDHHQARPRSLTADALDLHMACMTHAHVCRSHFDLGSSWKSESIRAFRKEEPPSAFIHRSRPSWTNDQMTIEAKQRVNRMFNSCVDVELTGFMSQPLPQHMASRLNKTVHGCPGDDPIMSLTGPLTTRRSDPDFKGSEARSQPVVSLVHQGSGSIQWTENGQDSIALDVLKQQTNHTKELRRLKADEDILKMQQQQLAGLCSGAALGVAQGKSSNKSYRPSMNGSVKSLI